MPGIFLVAASTCLSNIYLISLPGDILFLKFVRNVVYLMTVVNV